ncbi:hypothetical protein F4861DRAFT_490472 [Xylaria intraflava]|nr:hypothetical protein F4861DRAFT_490472 [Xylaria intraflava]
MALRDKQAFFEQLDACRSCDDDEDALGIEEQALRQKCRDFYYAAAPAPPILSTKSRPPGPRPRRTTSDPVFKSANTELEIIAVTPRYTRSTTAGPSLLHDSTIIPETEQPSKGRIRQETHPPPAGVLRSQSNLEPSPSVAITKRKRSDSLQMKPSSEQIFKGLSFFYIPNNDISPARRSKITKAREHGASWTKSSADATHVIADKGLLYADIRPFLDDNLTSSSVIFVNEDYPIECIRRRIVFDPKLTVEKRRYGVPGGPELTEEPTISQSLTQDSDRSLQIKSRQNAPAAVNSTPESTQESVMVVPSSQAEDTQSLKPATELTGGTALHADPKPHGMAQASIFTDELMACIDAVLDDPEKHEYLDETGSDTQGSENEGPLKKKRKWGPASMENSGNNAIDYDAFICMKGGTKGREHRGPNANTVKLLEEMAEEHSIWNETWRVQSYRKAIATLRRQPKRVATAKEAAALPNIGSSLADHIEEIARTGRFQKLEQIREEPSRAALKTFYNIYGVGVPTAMKWVELGYRTLDDLRCKARLSTNQKIGLEHYDDLLTRIPRVEVKALGDYVKDVAATIDPAVELIIGGSYRRGAESSGDIDLIVTKNGTTSSQDLVPFLNKLTDTLTVKGFLTAALASHRHDGGNMWHGCCVLPDTAFPGPREDYRPTWRRIDFLLVPQTEIGAALIYFTGNDLFNRSIRLLARKKHMKLNHRGLSGLGVQEGRDEKKIFEILGVRWREPHERWC